jgi:hypothetical protein
MLSGRNGRRRGATPSRSYLLFLPLAAKDRQCRTRSTYFCRGDLPAGLSSAARGAGLRGVGRTYAIAVAEASLCRWPE